MSTQTIFQSAAREPDCVTQPQQFQREIPNVTSTAEADDFLSLDAGAAYESWQSEMSRGCNSRDNYSDEFTSETSGCDFDHRASHSASNARVGSTGQWVRGGDVIILNEPGPDNRIPDREFAGRFFSSFPAQNKAASVGRSLPVSLFPARPIDPLTTDAKMERALTSAIGMFEKGHNLRPGTFPVRFTLVDITNPSRLFPSAGYRETVTDYIASGAKVAVMYAAYALRDMVQRFAIATEANSANLFGQLGRQMNPAIVKASARIARSLLMDTHRVPSYSYVFALTPTTGGVTVSFSGDFDEALEGMIVPSDNGKAGECVRGVGYGYLNSALAASNLFDTARGQGLWVGGDYQKGKVWPYVRIVSSNDGFVAQAGTTREMAKLVSLIITDRVLDPLSCAEMRGRLARTPAVDQPWMARTGVFRPATITHNKLGLGPLKSGKVIRSEVSVYQSPVAKDRRYVIAWQNLSGLWPIGFADLAKIIMATITEFER